MADELNEVLLTGQVVRKLVHDLASPVAAMRLLAEDADPLLQQAVGRLENRLALFRLIFGGGADDCIDSQRLWRLLAAVIDPATLSADIAGDSPARCQKALAAAVLAVAGRGAVAVTLGSASQWQLTVQQPRPAAISSLQPDSAMVHAPDPALTFAEYLIGPLHGTLSPDAQTFQASGQWSKAV